MIVRLLASETATWAVSSSPPGGSSSAGQQTHNIPPVAVLAQLFVFNFVFNRVTRDGNFKYPKSDGVGLTAFEAGLARRPGLLPEEVMGRRAAPPSRCAFL